MLLALMLAVTLILIALSIEAPRIAQQIQREKEEELIHRGKDYATAIKRFVHKNGGRFPVSIEQLEDTNHVRFLRKRYKDPMTGEDNWRLVHFGEAEVKIPPPPAGSLQTTNPGLGGGATIAGQGPAVGSPPGSSGTNGAPNQTFGSNTAPNGLGGNNQAGTNGSLTTSNIGNATGQPIGGGQIIGVASTSKKKGIKEFNEKDHYNDWFFVYDLRLEQSGGTGVAVGSPRAGAGTDNSSGQSGQGQQPAGANNGTLSPGAPPPTGTPGPTTSPTPNN